ncbi:MAG: hypothetical protein IPM71_15705 [Bacteroidota bacterium]|nr:MAG: hypothetical protein IPM71_15705 [Bacteroidota bacterium]
MKHKLIIIIVFLTGLISQYSFGQNEKSPEINVVYGDKHIFTIETPNGWINDKESAQTIGLVCFFYPKTEIGKSHFNYCYANGYDKVKSDESLFDFIKGDLDKFNKKYPDFTYNKLPIEITGGLRNAVLYSFSNLPDRYREEVLYSETDDSFIIFSFSAKTEEDYKAYQPIFDGLIASFNYRGNNPKPFLDFMNSKK